MTHEEHPLMIDLHQRLRSPLPKRLSLTNRPWFQRFLGITQINTWYHRFSRKLRLQGEASFWHNALESFELELDYDEAELANLATEGPLIVASNHPFGPIDGFILGGLVDRVRSDMKLLGIKESAELMPDLASRFISVDLSDNTNTARTNASALRQVFKHLRGGGTLGIFPSGRVMDFDLLRGRTYEKPWHPNVAAIASKANAAVVPVWIEGRNSLFYHIAGTLLPPTRLPLMLRELGVRKQRKIKLRIGKPFSAAEIAAFGSNQAATAALQARCKALA